MAVRCANASVFLRSIQSYKEAEEADVVGVWYWSGKAAYNYLPAWQKMSIKKAYTVFAGLSTKKIHLCEQANYAHSRKAIKVSANDRLYMDQQNSAKAWVHSSLGLPCSYHPIDLKA
jgi:hypothetical protein